MSRRAPTTDKITVSLAKELVKYADQRAALLGISRSQVIGEAVAEMRIHDEQELAREGYLFYAAEAEDFAAATLRAASEAIERVSG